MTCLLIHARRMLPMHSGVWLHFFLRFASFSFDCWTSSTRNHYAWLLYDITWCWLTVFYECFLPHWVCAFFSQLIHNKYRLLAQRSISLGPRNLLETAHSRLADVECIHLIWKLRIGDDNHKNMEDDLQAWDVRYKHWNEQPLDGNVD